MFHAAEYIFWLSLAVVVYTYAGYPLLLLLLVRLKNIGQKPVSAAHNVPLQRVTLIVAAYNEQEIINKKIQNTLQINYPGELLTIIFITDGSTDDTPAIVAQYPGITLLHEPERKGKLAAMNRAMQHVQTDFVVFSDANGMLNGDAIKNLLKHYADEKVGAVSGEKKIVKSEKEIVGKGEGLYWQYESALKMLDSRLCTVVGAAGELFSIRTRLYIPLPENVIIEDFVQSLRVCMSGYVVRYEPAAWSAEEASPDVRDEMERKVRISAGGFQAMAMLKGIFNVFRHPVLFFQYFSHRVLRWTLCPLSLISLFIASWAITLKGGGPFYGAAAMIQAVFYAFALAGWYLAKRKKRPLVFYFPFYFAFMNFCVFAGFLRYVSGSQHAAWKKAKRS
jgi:cellulose synthase/poly-beta-1,6-N-acetylglucosamine synthase-like glycosyltransferase